MIKFKNTETWGFEHALRGMRNPMNSWKKSDSFYGCEFGSDHDADYTKCNECVYDSAECSILNPRIIIGENDMKLAQKLIQAGSEHRKFMRQIFVSVDITAPLYWWKEFDTYKVGTTANSCSTMHKIQEKEFTTDDFSHEHLIEVEQHMAAFQSSLHRTIADLNLARELFLEKKDKRYWWQMIQLLPSSYNQKRTVTMTYENILSMVRQRKHHKLDEWSADESSFVSWAKTLPYAQELIFTGGGKTL